MKPLVLILTDRLSERMALRSLLNASGCMVTACGTVQLARDMVRRRAFDLAVLDAELPDGSGAALAEEIKADPQTRHMLVVLLSSSASPSGRDPSRGADACVQKPYTPEALALLIRELVRKSLGGKRYLLVDDSPTFLAGLTGKLRQADNEVLTATTGEEALSLLLRHDVDCIVLDMLMPGMGGIEACQRIRALPGRAGIPIVLLTASENLSDRSEGLTVGADAFLLKQYDLDLLYAHLREIVRKAPLRPRRKSDRISIPGTSRSSPLPSEPGTGGLCEQVLALTGLRPWVARLVLSRACSSAGTKSSSLTPPELRLTLPALAEQLRLFLPKDAVAARLGALSELARAADARIADGTTNRG
jgi:CheY-like chemotaxis protein